MRMKPISKSHPQELFLHIKFHSKLKKAPNFYAQDAELSKHNKRHSPTLRLENRFSLILPPFALFSTEK
jgi:hypothetical protein